MKLIERDALARLSAEAAARPRRRANWNLHPRLDDPIQRFCNAMQPGTYVRPHRHVGADRWEAFVVLQGAAAVVTFVENRLAERVAIGADRLCLGLEIEPAVWHAVVALVPDTVIFELKPGPYSALSDKDFASWAPAEGEPACEAFERWYRDGPVGSAAPPLGDDC